jgi:hypothetical protein
MDHSKCCLRSIEAEIEPATGPETRLLPIFFNPLFSAAFVARRRKRRPDKAREVLDRAGVLVQYVEQADGAQRSHAR